MRAWRLRQVTKLPETQARNGKISSQSQTLEATPKKPKGVPSFSQASTLKGPPPNFDEAGGDTFGRNALSNAAGTRVSRRPKYLKSRHASQRSSISSVDVESGFSSADESVNTATGGADYALQSGGAVPTNAVSEESLGLSRATSLGSLASGVTGLNDSDGPWDRGRTISGSSVLAGSGFGTMTESALGKLDEEGRSSRGSDTRNGGRTPDANTNGADMATPKGRNLKAPTDTVVAQHIRDMHIPASVARDYQSKHLSDRPSSPSKRAGMPTPSHPPGSSKHLTLKEQSTTIDRLHKENFNLKMKIYFLDSKLNNQSDEGVKEMINENVQHRVTIVTLQKEARTLKRNIRDLERRLRENEEMAAKGTADKGADEEGSSEAKDPALGEMEEEITYLRERVETYETEIEKLRNDNAKGEADRRRLGEIVKGLGERRGAEGRHWC